MSRDMEKRSRGRRDSPIDYMRAEDIKREKNHKMSYSGSRNKTRKSNSREPDSRRSSKTRTPDDSKDLSREYMENIWEMMKRLEDNLGIQSETMTQMSNLVEKMMVSTHNILELEEIRAKNLELKKKIMRSSHSPSIELPIEEEEDRNEDIRVTLLNKASSKWQQPPPQVGPNTRCYRCNKEGHQSPDCPIAEYGLWFCYYCQAVKNHKGNDCPKSDGSYHPKGKRGDRGSYRGKERFQPYHGSKHRDR